MDSLSSISSKGAPRMTEHDHPAFRQMFEDLWHSGLTRTPPRDTREHVLAAYVQALESYPLSAVRSAYAHLQRTTEVWPPVAAWIAAIRQHPLSALPRMTPQQARESDEAERLFYEGALCRCRACVDASATHLPVRYVPCLDANGAVIPMQHASRRRPVLRGEWIHGDRLKRWYVARAEFYQKLDRLKPKAIPKADPHRDPEAVPEEVV